MPRASTTSPSTSPARPAWPFPDVVRLTAHPSGQWCGHFTVEGKRRTAYFGRWDDSGPTGQAQLDALHAWRSRIRAIHDGTDTGAGSSSGFPRHPTLRTLCKLYLSHMESTVGGTDGIARSTFTTECSCLRIALRTLDPHQRADTLGPADFARLHRAIRGHSPYHIAHIIDAVKRAYRWAHADHGFPMPTFGSSFRRPRKRSERIHDDANPKVIYSPLEVRALIAAAPPITRAQILLGINGGYGATDMAHAKWSQLDRALGDEWGTGERWARLDGIRFKTGTKRPVTLWPETLRALLDARATMPHPNHRLLLTSEDGTPIVHDSSTGKSRIDTVSQRINRIIRRLAAAGAPGGRGSFYRLRHTFATIAQTVGGVTGAGDPDTCMVIMGHVGNAVHKRYIHDHGWKRIDATCASLRAWVFDVDERTVRGAWCGVLPRLPVECEHRMGSSIARRAAHQSTVESALASLPKRSLRSGISVLDVQRAIGTSHQAPTAWGHTGISPDPDTFSLVPGARCLVPSPSIHTIRRILDAMVCRGTLLRTPPIGVRPGKGRCVTYSAP